MSAYLVSYDLGTSGRNYEAVISDLKRAAGAKATRVLYSVWIVETELSAEGLLKAVKEGDPEGSYIVVHISAPWARHELRAEADISLIQRLLD